MSRGRHAFKQGDLVKAIKGVTKAGLSVARVEIDATGKIVVIPGTSTQNDRVDDGELVDSEEWN